MRPALALLLLTGAAGCTTETLQGGTYTFAVSADGGFDDPCHLYTGALGSGTLQVAGETLDLLYSVDGLILQGEFAASEYQQPDQFLVDGSQATATALIHDADGGSFSCPSTYLQADMTGIVTGARGFVGQLTLTYTMQTTETNVAQCIAGLPPTCTLTAGYVATSSQSP